MTNLQSKIDALPSQDSDTDWLAYLESEPQHEPDASIARAWRAERTRLALLREWVAWVAHDPRCGTYLTGECTCGRAALLKATELPR